MVEIIKNSYLETMANYYIGKKCTGPWTREWVQEIIELIDTRNRIVIRKWSVYGTNLKTIYASQLQGGRVVLMRILKSIDNTFNTVPVVPWEDSFDFIWEAHLVCGHGNITQTMNLIKSKYFINLVFVAELIKICCCQDKKHVSDLVHYNIEGSVQILDMTAYPDKDFKYVLVYNDKHTGLIQLRPLVQVSELEISLELVKMFTDLGPPKKLVVYEPYFYDIVIENVNRVFTPCTIELEFDVILNENKYKDQLSELSVMLIAWMKMNQSMNWTIGCYSVQWKINVNAHNGEIPFQQVFGHHECGKENARRMKAPKNISSTVTESIASRESNAECILITDTSDGDKNHSEMDKNVEETNHNIKTINVDIEDPIDNIPQHVEPHLNLQAEQFCSYQDEYLQFTENNRDKRFPNYNRTLHQNTGVNIVDKDITIIADIDFKDKKDSMPSEMELSKNYILVGQNDNEPTPNKLIKTEFPPVTFSDDIKKETDMSCVIKSEKSMETKFLCWRCEKEMDWNDRPQDSETGYTEIICQSCIKPEEIIT